MAIVGGALGIKPVLMLSEGAIHLVDKGRGRPGALVALYRQLDKQGGVDPAYGYTLVYSDDKQLTAPVHHYLHQNLHLTGGRVGQIAPPSAPTSAPARWAWPLSSRNNRFTPIKTASPRAERPQPLAGGFLRGLQRPSPRPGVGGQQRRVKRHIRIAVDAALRVLLVGSFGHLAQVSPKFLCFFLGSMGANGSCSIKPDLLFVLAPGSALPDYKGSFSQ